MGLGRHVNTVPLSNITELLQLVYAGYLMFDIGIVFPKLSVLFFYERVFGRANRRMVLIRWIFISFIVAWLLFRIPADIWGCTPPKKSWLPDTPGHCLNDLNNFAIYLAAGLFNSLLDLALLIIPLPMIWKLQMRPMRKIGIFAAFVCGYW